MEWGSVHYLTAALALVNIFILTIRVGSELRGTSHSRSAELHNWAHAGARGISTFESNFVTSQLCCPLWPLRAAPQCEECVSLAAHVRAHQCVSLMCTAPLQEPHRQTL